MTTDAPREEDFKVELVPSSPSHDASRGELVYHPGSEVAGNLIVKVDSPRLYHNIRINLRGEGRVKWTKTSVHVHGSNTGGANFTTSIAIRQADKLYVDLSKGLWDKSESSDSSLPAGTHSFPFHFVLPQGIPSSHDSKLKIPAPVAFDDGEGSTRYTLTGCISYGYDADEDHTTKKILVVKEIVETPNTPQLLQPFRLHVRKAAGYWCSCVSGVANIILEVPKTVFSLNEEIPYSVRVENEGSVEVEATATLEEHIVYHTRFRKCYPKVIEHGRVNNGSTQPGNSLTLSPELKTLKVPSKVILIKNSTIIKQSFMLKVKVRIPHVIFNPVLKCPLTIGNSPPSVATQSVPPQEPGVSASPKAKASPENTTCKTATSAGASGLTTPVAPPSYKEALKSSDF